MGSDRRREKTGEAPGQCQWVVVVDNFVGDVQSSRSRRL